MDTTNIDDTNKLNVSENLFDNNQIAEYLRKDISLNNNNNNNKQIADNLGKNKNQGEVLSIIEDSLSKISLLSLSNDITFGLSGFEFESGLKDTDEFNYSFLRKKTHALVMCACAQAAYFVGVANRIRRNIEDIKNGLIKPKNSVLLNQINKVNGLQIGIIGGGKVGKQLALALMEYAEVYPHELQISTRQPDALTYFKNKNVRCFYDNAKVASSVNILFLCVLPSQLPLIVQDIKSHLPDKCIIYSLVQTESAQHLKNLICNELCRMFIIKPDLNLNKKFIDSNWNFSLSVSESLGSVDMIKMSNPFSDGEESILINTETNKAVYLYAFINICAFLGLKKQESLNAIKSYLFSAASIKLEEVNFYDKPSTISSFFPVVDLVEIGSKQSPLSLKLEKSRSFNLTLRKNYIDYFQDMHRWKN